MKQLLFVILIALFSIAVGAETIEKTFSIDGHPTLNLSNISGDIHVMQGNEGEIIVKAENPNPKVEVVFKQAGNKITVETKYPRHTKNIKEGVRFEVWIPMYSDVKLNTVSGDIVLGSVEGRLYLNSVSGNIDMSEVAGNLKLNTVSGDISLNGLGDSDLDANAVSGDIILSNASLASGNYEFNSTSGDIEIWHSAEASYNISGQSLSGDMVQKTGDQVSISKAKYTGMKSLSGTYNTGDAEIDCNTISGDIRIGVK